MYDGTGKAATATTTPADLTVLLTYDGSSDLPINAGSYKVVGAVSDANYSGSVTNTLVITQAEAAIALADLSHVYDGTGKSATATTIPADLAVIMIYDGSSDLPVNAGSYEVVATVNAANYSGSNTNTLIITKPEALVTLANLSQVYDGTGKAATATTTPSDLAVVLNYDGSSGLPVNAGSYEVIAIVNESNYSGSVTNTLVITQAEAAVTLASLSQVYDGTGKTATASTIPADLNVLLTYDGLAEAPVNAGSYQVVGTVRDANYSGSATNTLVISRAEAAVTLANLSQVYGGTAREATFTTIPGQLIVELTYDGNTMPPVSVGRYEVAATIMDANYTGSASGVLVISAAQPVIPDSLVVFTVDASPVLLMPEIDLLASGLTEGSGITVSVTIHTNAFPEDALFILESEEAEDEPVLRLTEDSVLLNDSVKARWAGGFESEPLILQFGEDVALSEVQAILRRLAFETISTVDLNRQVRITVEGTALPSPASGNIEVIVNFHPRARNLRTITAPGSQVGILLPDFTTRASDADGDDLVVTEILPPNSGTLSTNGTALVYQPMEGHIGSDVVRFRIEDGQGGSDWGEWRVYTLAARELAAVDLGQEDPELTGIVQLVSAGWPGEIFAIYGSSDLKEWIYLGRATVDANGLLHFIDPAGTQQGYRFYKTRLEP